MTSNSSKQKSRRLPTQGRPCDLGGARDRRPPPDWRDSTTVALPSTRLRLRARTNSLVPQIGSWKSTHRWACVPKWSFFAGRGIPGPTDVNHGNTVLWNLRKISGDFDLEIFAAPLEGTAQRAHFTFPTSLNVAFAADGTDLASGYNFVECTTSRRNSTKDKLPPMTTGLTQIHTP